MDGRREGLVGKERGLDGKERGLARRKGWPSRASRVLIYLLNAPECS